MNPKPTMFTSLVTLIVLDVSSPPAVAHGRCYFGPDCRVVPRFSPLAEPEERARDSSGLIPCSRRPGLEVGCSNGECDWDSWWRINQAGLLRQRAQAINVRAEIDGADHCFGPLREEDVARMQRLSRRQIRRDAIPLVRVGLGDPYFQTRAATAIALGKATPSCPDFKGVVAEVRKLLADPDRRVRESACLGLGLLGHKSQVPDLLLIMRDDPKGRALCGSESQPVHPRQRAFAAIAIGLIGSQVPLDESVIDELRVAAACVASRRSPPESIVDSRAAGDRR